MKRARESVITLQHDVGLSDEYGSLIEDIWLNEISTKLQAREYQILICLNTTFRRALHNKLRVQRIHQIRAIRCNRLEFKHVEIQTPELCLAAVQHDGFELEWVKQQTHEICLAAVRQTHLALKHVRKRTPEIRLAAVRKTAQAKCYMKKQTLSSVL